MRDTRHDARLFSRRARPGPVIWRALPVVVLAATLGLCRGQAAWADLGTDVACMIQSVARVTSSARVLKGAAIYGCDDGYSLMGAFISPGESISVAVSVLEGKGYAFLAGADDNAADVDIRVTDSAGKEICKDTGKDLAPAVSFKASGSGDYTVTISLPEARRRSFCALLTLKEGGRPMAPEQLNQAMAKYVLAAVALGKTWAGGKVCVSEEPGAWILYGAILGQRQTASMSSIPLATHRHMFVAVGSDKARSVELSLFADPNRFLEADGEGVNPAMFQYATSLGTRYVLKTQLLEASEPSLVITGMFDLLDPR
ncbi:MAG: hypothetical protein V2A77_06820 [Pseudomonadota bacterium]